jgi:hypothetical protein
MPIKGGNAMTMTRNLEWVAVLAGLVGAAVAIVRF